MDSIDTKQLKIDELIEKGYDIDIGGCIAEAFDIFKQRPGMFIGFLITQGLIGIVLSFIPLIGTLASWVINPALTVGIFIVARKIKYNEPVAMGDFFNGFKKFGELFLATLIMGILITVGLFLLIIPGLYLAVSYAFVTLFIYFMFDGQYWQTLERSRKLISKEWFQFFGFFLVILLFNLAGLLCLGIGLLVTLPVSQIALYVCFERLLGTEDELLLDIENIQAK